MLEVRQVFTSTEVTSHILKSASDMKTTNMTLLQVVMSRGGYTNAIDLWSLGCIFGELLQRVAGLGGASTPQLQIAPMFAIHGKPTTPGEG